MPIHDARPVARRHLARPRGLRGAARRERGPGFLGRGRGAARLLSRGAARDRRGDRRQQGVHLRSHAAPSRERRRRPGARHAAPACDRRACRSHRDVRPAARARLLRRRGRGTAARPRAGDQPVAADPWSAARCAARGVRCRLGRAERSRAVRSGVPEPRGRDLRRHLQSRRIAGSTCRRCSRTRRCC